MIDQNEAPKQVVIYYCGQEGCQHRLYQRSYPPGFAGAALGWCCPFHGFATGHIVGVEYRTIDNPFDT